MNITLWGTRGSLATPGPETARYGGNTACVQVTGEDGRILVLDAGTGIRRLGEALPRDLKRIDVLLTHLHMDHLQGLGFFRPLRTPGVEVHIWGPASTTMSLRARLARYLSPPLFPVMLRDLESDLHVHEVPVQEIVIDGFNISASWICHPDPTVGFRIEAGGRSIAYLPDHEPALGGRELPRRADWISGYALAHGVDLLIHDAQYTDSEYGERVGWGHSAMSQTLAFAGLAHVKHLVPFHHDPSHTDQDLDRIWADVTAQMQPPYPVTPAMEGMTFELPTS
jgi:phosphoribosyl 1,2-cyclic phosphodiesterase